MISYDVYLLLHLAGVFGIFTALGAVALHAASGGTRATNPARRAVAGLHGVALLLVLVAGFGLLARTGLMTEGVPGWIWAKLAIWVLLGLMLALPYRVSGRARSLLLLLPLLGALAAWLAIYKPF